MTAKIDEKGLREKNLSEAKEFLPRDIIQKLVSLQVEMILLREIKKVFEAALKKAVDCDRIWINHEDSAVGRFSLQYNPSSEEMDGVRYIQSPVAVINIYKKVIEIRNARAEEKTLQEILPKLESIFEKIGFKIVKNDFLYPRD